MSKLARGESKLDGAENEGADGAADLEPCEFDLRATDDSAAWSLRP
jgi:hypothetical protein